MQRLTVMVFQVWNQTFAFPNVSSAMSVKLEVRQKGHADSQCKLPLPSLRNALDVCSSSMRTWSSVTLPSGVARSPCPRYVLLGAMRSACRSSPRRASIVAMPTSLCRSRLAAPRCDTDSSYLMWMWNKCRSCRHRHHLMRGKCITMTMRYQISAAPLT